MHHFYLPIKLSASYFKMNTDFTTPLIELILPSKFYISRKYSHEIFLKILKITNFINFLVKNVDFEITKLLLDLWDLILESSEIVQNFFEVETIQCGLAAIICSGWTGQNPMCSLCNLFFCMKRQKWSKSHFDILIQSYLILEITVDYESGGVVTKMWRDPNQKNKKKGKKIVSFTIFIYNVDSI